MSRSGIEYFSKNHASGLRSINLTGCWELIDSTILQMLSKFTKYELEPSNAVKWIIFTPFPYFSLQFISLANIYSLTDQTMRAIANYTRDLRALDIRYG